MITEGESDERRALQPFVTLSDGANVHVVTDVDNERQDAKC